MEEKFEQKCFGQKKLGPNLLRNQIFFGRPLMEDERHLLREDNLCRKATFAGKQHLMEDDIRPTTKTISRLLLPPILTKL